MNTLVRLNEDLKSAMRAKDRVRLLVLRSIVADLKYAGIEKKGAKGLDGDVDSPAEYLEESEMIAVFRSMVKRRKESATQYIGGDRGDLADKELAEVAIIEEFLPKELSSEELGSIVKMAIKEVGASNMKDMGRVMKVAQSKASGRADGKSLSECVRKQLS